MWGVGACLHKDAWHDGLVLNVFIWSLSEQSYNREVRWVRSLRDRYWSGDVRELAIITIIDPKALCRIGSMSANGWLVGLSLFCCSLFLVLANKWFSFSQIYKDVYNCEIYCVQLKRWVYRLGFFFFCMLTVICSLMDGFCLFSLSVFT